MKRLTVLLLLFFPLSVPVSADERWDIWTTSPWIALLARFIGGVYVEVRPLSAWNDAGTIVRLVQRQDVPFSARILCLDGADLKEHGFSPSDWKETHCLYDFLPFPREEIDSYLSDPSVLPFVAQRLLIVVSKWDQTHYAYFQRRLAEFQTRLESTVIVGRKMLSGTRMVDITGSSSQFLKAAACVLERPHPASLDLWSRGEAKEDLLAFVADRIKSDSLPVIDDSTPIALREALSTVQGVAKIGRPLMDQDILLSFYDRYLSLWNMTSRGKKETSSVKGKESKR